MRNIITRHRRNTKDRDRTGSLDINGLLITGCKTAVQVSRITSVRRYLFHSDRHFLLCICVVRHIGKKYQYFLTVKRKLLCNSKCHIRHQRTLYGRVRRGMDKHNRMAHSTTFFQCITECKVIVIFQSHTSKYDHVYFRLQCNT